MEIRVEMCREALAAMDDEALIWACVEPIIIKIRGRDSAIKTETYGQLSAGQQALMMYQVLRGHSSSGMMEFFRLIPYLPSKEGVWQELQRAMRYFEADAFAQLLISVEGDYRSIKTAGAAVGMDDIADAVEGLGEDSELIASIQRHDRLFREAMPGARKRVAAKIRSNWAEFLELRDEYPFKRCNICRRIGRQAGRYTMHLGATLYVHNSVEAVAFYQEAFGLEVGYHEMHPDGSFLHAELCKNGTEVFAVSESSNTEFVKTMLTTTWPTMSYGIDFGSEEETRKAYFILMREGHILRPLGPLPWNPCCADLVDKFGVYWYIYTNERRPMD